jgi:hypothetical protein
VCWEGREIVNWTNGHVGLKSARSSGVLMNVTFSSPSSSKPLPRERNVDVELLGVHVRQCDIVRTMPNLRYLSTGIHFFLSIDFTMSWN